MPKINAEGVVTDATLSGEPEPVEPDDLTPKPEPEKPKVSDPIELKPAARRTARKP